MRTFTLLLLALPLVLATGCGNLNRVPRYDMNTDLKLETYKRYAKFAEQDYAARWGARAWEPHRGEMEGPITADQKLVLERHGQPDWKRFRFLSTSHELVDQWAWWDRNTTVQFVQGQLVYEGPLTDMDEWLIRHGYPQQARTLHPTTGVRRDMWNYSSLFFRPQKHVTFTNEQLISEFDY